MAAAMKERAMTSSRRYLVVFGVTVFVAGFTVGTIWQPDTGVQAQGSGKVFELRTYTTAEGKLPNLQARFRDHTMRIFDRHNIENVGYWVPQELPNTLIYIISHDSRQAAQENWQGFRDDSEWPGVAEASGVGRVNVESVFMEAADYSPLK
jgi:hypothetical protein|tara:strand:+ start:5706 stop:6158 length:453 start_codon:yes stop_codon:yes gene_type:complete